MSNISDNEPSGRGWLSIAWGLAVIAAFIAIRAFMHFNGTSAPAGDSRHAVPEDGISVRLVIHSCSEEYAGPSGGDLNLTTQATDIESAVTIRGQTKTTRSQSDNRIPNPDAGEIDRCRLVFDGNGRVFLHTHQRAAMGGAEMLDVRAVYELEIVEGSRADFEAGREIRLAYTPESLAQRREALRKSLALQCVPILQRELPRDGAGVLDMQCVVEPLPQSSMIATPSSLLIEDSGPVKAVITVAVSGR